MNVSASNVEVESLRLERDQLKRELFAERQKVLNMTDAVLGAEAAQAQAVIDNDDLFEELHYVATELAHLKELLGYEESATVGEIEADLARPWGGGSRIALHLASNLATTGARRARKLTLGRLDRNQEEH